MARHWIEKSVDYIDTDDRYGEKVAEQFVALARAAADKFFAPGSVIKEAVICTAPGNRGDKFRMDVIGAGPGGIHSVATVYGSISLIGLKLDEIAGKRSGNPWEFDKSKDVGGLSEAHRHVRREIEARVRRGTPYIFQRYLTEVMESELAGGAIPRPAPAPEPVTNWAGDW